MAMSKVVIRACAVACVVVFCAQPAAAVAVDDKFDKSVFKHEPPKMPGAGAGDAALEAWLVESLDAVHYDHVLMPIKAPWFSKGEDKVRAQKRENELREAMRKELQKQYSTSVRAGSAPKRVGP